MICPNCHKEIDYVRYKEKSFHYGDFSIARDGSPLFENDDTETTSLIFYCPECDYEITDDETEIYEMLSDIKNKTNQTIPSNKNNLAKKYAA